MTTLAPVATLDTNEVQATIATLDNDRRDYLQAMINRFYPYASACKPYTARAAWAVAKAVVRGAIKAGTMAADDGTPEVQRRIEFATALIAAFLQQ